MDTSKIQEALEKNRALQAKIRLALQETGDTLVELDKDIENVRESILRPSKRAFSEKRNHHGMRGRDYFTDPVTGEAAPKSAAAIAKQKVRESVQPYVDAATIAVSAQTVVLVGTATDSSGNGVEQQGEAGSCSGQAVEGSKARKKRKKTTSAILSQAREAEGETWSAAEESALVEAVEEHQGFDWPAIADLVSQTHCPTSPKPRSAFSCFQHYQQALNPDLARGPWSAEEDATLIQAVQALGASSSGKHVWGLVADQLEGRAASQCRERWLKSVSPHLVKGPWTDLEERLLVLAVRAKAQSAAASSSSSSSPPHQTNIAASSSSSSTGTEAEAQQGSGARDFTVNWKEVSVHVPRRDGPKCREKWCNVLSPALRRGPWSSQEDEVLQAGVAALGAGSWAAIAKHCFPDGARTDYMCKQRFGKLRKDELREHTQRVREVAGALPAKLNRRKQKAALVKTDFHG